jgi:hypothetical protein
VKGQVDTSLLNGLKIFRVAGHKWHPEPDRYSSNQAIGKFENGTMLPRRCLDGCGGKIAGGCRGNLFVLVEPG